MIIKQKTILTLLVVLLCVSKAYSHEDKNVIAGDTEQAEDSIHTETKQSFLKQWWDGIAHGNVDHTFERPMDITFAAAPYYSQESNFGIGGSLTSLFRINRKDSLMQPSDFSLMAGASLNGTYSMGVDGNIHLTRNHRLKFLAQFRHLKRNFWGINYAACDVNPVCDTEINRTSVSIDYQQRFYGNWFWGLSANINYIKASPDSIRYLEGQSSQGLFAGMGALVQYDSRDFALNAKKGIYFLYRVIYFPQFQGKNEKDIIRTTICFNAYHKLWRDAVLAYDLYSEYNTSKGIVPWQLREEINVDDHRMRGYYAGRYIDENQTCLQVELRQHIWKRVGAVAWAGVGCFFNDSSEIKYDSLLPNYGVGFRFEIKHNTNLRLDLGFGRDASAIALGFAEAF